MKIKRERKLPTEAGIYRGHIIGGMIGGVLAIVSQALSRKYVKSRWPDLVAPATPAMPRRSSEQSEL